MNHVVIAKLHIVDMLEEILAEGKTIMLHKGAEGDYSGSADRKFSTAATLEGCVEQWTKNPRTKICLRADCVAAGQPRPLSCFGADKDSADGHAGVCKACEAKRVGSIGKKKKNVNPPMQNGPSHAQEKPGT